VGAAAEKAGIPAVSIVGSEFVTLAMTAVQGQGLPALATVVIPQGVMSGAIPDIRPASEAAVKDIVSGLTAWKPPEGVSLQKKTFVFEGANYDGAVDNMNAYFLSQKWSDGMPLIPATKERVDWMLTGTALPRDKVITKELEPRKGQVTVENVAVNAVMAGARPEYLPVILAAAELVSNGSWKLNTSTGNHAAATIINGPIAKELNINSGPGCMGPGWKANATIGRAIRLYLINGGGGFSGPGGKPTTQATPGAYGWVFAENEEENPWQPLNMELGYKKDTNTISIAVARGSQNISAFAPAANVAYAIAFAVRGQVEKSIAYAFPQLVVLSPAHATTLANAGWSKKDIQNFVFEKARIPLAEVEATGRSVGSKELEQQLVGAAKSTLVPVINKPEQIVIIVAGSSGSDNSTLIPSDGSWLTTEIDKYKPANWQQLIKTAKEELRY